MQTSLAQPALQQQTLRFYCELMLLERNWAGKLVIGAGEGCSWGGFPAACSLAGAACLLLEPSAPKAKAALRDGGIDFLVSTVDEALRTLKNEIRKCRPLAVVVTGDVPAALAELVERGISPDLLLFTETGQGTSQAEAAWAGVRRLDANGEDKNEGTKELQEFLSSSGFATYTWPLPGRAAVRGLDRGLLEMFSETDDLRRRWLEGITRYQRSADQDYRTCWVTEDELDQVADLLSAQAL